MWKAPRDHARLISFFSCPYCSTKQAVSLTIKIKDYRNCYSRESSNFSSTPSSYNSSENIADSPSTSKPSLPIPSHFNNQMVKRAVHGNDSPVMAHSFSPPGISRPMNIRRAGKQHYTSSAPGSASSSPGAGLQAHSPKFSNRLTISRSNSIPGIGSQSSLYGTYV